MSESGAEGFTGETADEKLTRELLTKHGGIYGLARALEASQREIVRKDRKIASLEREQERLWKLINAAEAREGEQEIPDSLEKSEHGS